MRSGRSCRRQSKWQTLLNASERTQQATKLACQLRKCHARGSEPRCKPMPVFRPKRFRTTHGFFQGLGRAGPPQTIISLTGPAGLDRQTDLTSHRQTGGQRCEWHPLGLKPIKVPASSITLQQTLIRCLSVGPLTRMTDVVQSMYIGKREQRQNSGVNSSDAKRL